LQGCGIRQEISCFYYVILSEESLIWQTGFFGRDNRSIRMTCLM